METSCSNCRWNYNDNGTFHNCYPFVGICTNKSKWIQYEPLPPFSVEGEPTSRYDIHVSGLSNEGIEVRIEVPMMAVGEE